MKTVNTETPSYAQGLSTLRTGLSEMLPKEALDVFDNDAEALEKSYTSILKVQKGEKVVDFSLPNATGQIVKLSELLTKGKVVMTFYRGSWCPYCNLQLGQYQQILPEIESYGGQLVAISPQSPDESLNIKEKNELSFEVLTDKGNMVAREFTTVFKYGDAPVKTMTELGFDFDHFYLDDSREIPVPAVFIIGQDQSVLFAKAVGGDYRNRVEPSDILEALSSQS